MGEVTVNVGEVTVGAGAGVVVIGAVGIGVLALMVVVAVPDDNADEVVVGVVVWVVELVEVVWVAGWVCVVAGVVVAETVEVTGGVEAETKIPKVVMLLFSLDSSTVLSPSTFNSIKLYPSEAQYKLLQERV